MEVIHTTYSEMCEIPNKNGCYVTEYGDKFYYRNNKCHRDSGPAIEFCGGYTHWYRKGFIHRICGPAVEWGDGINLWYVFDIKYTEDDYNKVISNLPLLYWNNRGKLWK